MLKLAVKFPVGAVHVVAQDIQWELHVGGRGAEPMGDSPGDLLAGQFAWSLSE